MIRKQKHPWGAKREGGEDAYTYVSYASHDQLSVATAPKRGTLENGAARLLALARSARQRRARRVLEDLAHAFAGPGVRSACEKNNIARTRTWLSTRGSASRRFSARRPCPAARKDVSMTYTRRDDGARKGKDNGDGRERMVVDKSAR